MRPMAQITFEFNDHTTQPMPHVWDVKAKGCQSKGMSQPMGCQGNEMSKQYRGSQSGNFGGETMRQNWRQDSTLENDM